MDRAVSEQRSTRPTDQKKKRTLPTEQEKVPDPTARTGHPTTLRVLKEFRNASLCVPDVPPYITNQNVITTDLQRKKTCVETLIWSTHDTRFGCVKSRRWLAAPVLCFQLLNEKNLIEAPFFSPKKETAPLGMEGTDFGQSRFGHPDLTNYGQSNFGQSNLANPIWPILDCGAAKSWGPPRVGPRRVGAQNFALFSLSRHNFLFFFPSLVVFFVEFWWCLKRRALAYMCVKRQMRLYVCQALSPPKHQMRLHVCHQMRLYVCHQMRSHVCHQMRLLNLQRSSLRSLIFARFARTFFKHSKLEFLSEEHSCLNIDSCLVVDSCVNIDSCPNTDSCLNTD